MSHSEDAQSSLGGGGGGGGGSMAPRKSAPPLKGDIGVRGLGFRV